MTSELYGKCRDCIWWTVERKDARFGICHRYPTQETKLSISFCGEFQRDNSREVEHGKTE